MPKYAYRALTATGRLTTGSVDEATRDSALHRLKSENLTPVAINELEDRATRARTASSTGRAKVSSKDLAGFTRQLSSLLEAGMTVDRALAMCTRLSHNRKLQQALDLTREAVLGGAPLSDALAVSGGLNDTRLVGMVRAAEAGGFLPLALGLLADTLEDEAEMSAFIKASLAYPMVVALLACVSCLVLAVVIVPRFELMLKPLGKDLPPLTAAVVGVSRFVIRRWYLLIAAGLALPIVGGALTSSDAGKTALDRLKLRLPLFGGVNLAVCTARILRTWSVMLKGGVPMLDALALARGAGGNRYLAERLAELCASVATGESLSSMLSRTSVLPPSVAEFVAIGEESGNLPAMLERVAKVYEQEAKTKLKTLLSLLEPLTVIALAGLVLVVVMALILPTLQLNRAIM